MLYLAKLTLSTDNPAALRTMGDLHALHRFVLQGFPDADMGGPGRVLFRFEAPRAPREQPFLLVQSEKEPNAEAWGHMACVEGPRSWEPTFAVHQRLRFRLRATPTKAKTFGPEEERPGHRRIGLYTEEEQQQWLTRKAEENGFSVADVRLRKIGWQSGRKPGGAVITHHAVEFDGILQVRDADALVAAIRGGIGPAKGFGFGLLSLARV
jgi:CRISPR system Cascade subunit CasE